MNGQRVPWETCQTFSGSWGYHRDETTWKGVEAAARCCSIDTVSKGGNLLLNVGPTARGTFDQRAQDRLAAIGEWMQLHGRSIYGCTAGARRLQGAAEHSLLTYNPATNRLYVHLLDWPMGELALRGLCRQGRVRAVAARRLRSEDERTKAARPGSARRPARATLVLALPIVKPAVEIPVVELFLR